MYYNVLEAKELINSGDEKFDKKLLLQNGNSSLVIVSLKKGEIIDTHTSKENAAVYILDGEIEIHFLAEKFKLQKDEIIMFKKDEEHKVLALKDSKFFVIKI